MSHPDHETRVLAHRVLFNVLIPSGILPSVSGNVTYENSSGEKENHARESLPDGKTV